MNKYVELAMETLESDDELIEEVFDRTIELHSKGMGALEARELAYANVLSRVLPLVSNYYTESV